MPDETPAEKLRRELNLMAMKFYEETGVMIDRVVFEWIVTMDGKAQANLPHTSYKS